MIKDKNPSRFILKQENKIIEYGLWKREDRRWKRERGKEISIIGILMGMSKQSAL